MRKPIRGNVPMALTDEQIIELRKIYKQIRQIKYSHAYAMLCLADTTKEERAFFAALGDINNGRSYEEEQTEVGRILQLIDDGTPWYEAHEEASDRIVPVYLTAEEKSIAKRYAAAKGITLPDACKEALFEKIEDEYDSAVAEEAYTEYVASGCKSTPIDELWQELDLEDEDEESKLPVYSHLAQAMDDIKHGRVQPADSVFAEILTELAEQPNAETVAAIEEVEVLKADPNKKSYGSFAEILAEQPNAETIAAMIEAERIIHDPTAPRYQDVEEALAALKADEDDEVDEKLQEAEREADLTEQRYSSEAVQQAMQEAIQGKLIFKTNLTMEEIERNFEGFDLFSELKAGLEEALEYTKGNLNAHTRRRSTTSIYPIILTPDGEGFTVYVPDFDINTQGEDLTEAIVMARDAIGLMGIDMQDDGKKIPVPSNAMAIHAADGDMISLVDVDFAEYRRKNDIKAEKDADPLFSEITAGGAFTEQILAELIASGLTGNELLEEFRKKQAQIQPAVKRMIAAAHDAAQGNGECYTYDDVFGEENEPQIKADEAADLFFSESNKEFLRRGIEALDAGEGVEYELLEAEIVNEGLADLEKGKTVDGDAVRARMAEKYGV